MKLPYIKTYADRHGKLRHYFRRKGYPTAALPHPNSPSFITAYEAANAIDQTEYRGDRITFIRGSLGWCINKFAASEKFNARGTSTVRADRIIFDRLKEQFGGGLLKDLKAKHVKAIRNHFLEQHTASIADQAVGRLSVLWKFADDHLDLDLDLEANPTIGVSRVHNRKEADERLPWTDEMFAAFDAHAPAHLQLAVLLGRYTGQRRSDVVKMKWSQFDGDTIEVVQQKTGEFVVVPCHARLRAVLQSMQRRGDFILVGERGKPYDPASLARLVREQLKRLGISGYSFHGLRKNAAQALAEAGCSIDEIMAVTGHRSAKMALHYTKRAARKELAKNAVRKLEAYDARRQIKVVS